MASTGIIQLVNANLNDVTGISVKINGDTTERFVSINKQTGLLTFTSLNDGLKYNYVVRLLFSDQREGVISFSHGCQDCGGGTPCVSPTSVSIIGDTQAQIGTSKTYTLSTIGGSNFTYQWSIVGGVINGSSTANSVTVIWGNDVNVSSSISVNAGCEGAVFVSDNKVVTLTELPPSCVTPSSISISGNIAPEVGTTQTYTSSVVGGVNFTYQWSVTGGVINGSSTGSSVSVTWGTNTSSTSSISVSAGCEAGTPVTDTEAFTLSPVAPTCTTPTSVNIVGNINPTVNTTETYSLNVVGGNDYYYVWNVVGGTTNGSATSSTLNVTWGSDTASQSLISISVGCVGGTQVGDTESFVLSPVAPTCTLPSAINISGNFFPDSGSTQSYTSGVTGGSNFTYQWIVVGGTISGSSIGSGVSVIWDTQPVAQSSITLVVSCEGGATDSATQEVFPI